MVPALTAISAAGIGGALAWFGHRDLTHPAVAFGVPWFAAAAIAQIRLTRFPHAWSASFAVLVIAGGAMYVAAAYLACGRRSARGSRIVIDRSAYRANDLLPISVVLLLGAAAGWAYKSTIFHGIPLLSGNIDAVRARVLASGGVPAWSSLLTEGAPLAAWCLIAWCWLTRGEVPRSRLALAALLLLAALFGAAADGSRNEVMVVVAVPLIALYLLHRGRLGVPLVVGGAVLVLALGSAAFVLRLSQVADGGGTQAGAIERQAPTLIRPILPIYIGITYPLEAERRLFAAVPSHISLGLGAFSLASFPSAMFPNGKPDYSAEVGSLDGHGSAVYWTVATYQGRALADFGAIGVIAVSGLLGLMFGGTYRALRASPGLFGVAAIALLSYYAAFMIYDNLLSFTVIAVYDLLILALVNRIVHGRRSQPASAPHPPEAAVKQA